MHDVFNEFAVSMSFRSCFKLAFVKTLFFTARLLHKKQNTLYYYYKNFEYLDITLYTKHLPEAL